MCVQNNKGTAKKKTMDHLAPFFSCLHRDFSATVNTDTPNTIYVFQATRERLRFDASKCMSYVIHVSPAIGTILSTVDMSSPSAAAVSRVEPAPFEESIDLHWSRRLANIVNNIASAGKLQEFMFVLNLHMLGNVRLFSVSVQSMHELINGPSEASEAVDLPEEDESDHGSS